MKVKITNYTLLIIGLAALFYSWHQLVGFDWQDKRWWVWLLDNIKINGILPKDMMMSLYIVAGSMIFSIFTTTLILTRASAKTIIGGREAGELHGSAKWATKKEIKSKKSALKSKKGVVVGGFEGKTLFNDGPEHILCFAPTGSGKGVGLVIPTLLNWQESVMVLDIKGENYALTSGYRASIGQEIIKFSPTSEEGSAHYNPLAEVRVNTGNVIADCQNIASMIIDPDGKGLKDFWMQSGWEWLSVVILHVIYSVKKDENRTANLKDVNLFMSAASSESEDADVDNFDVFLDDMAAYEHTDAMIKDEVARGASLMKIKAGAERSGVHSSASVQLALYADPIVSKNIEKSDFRISDLMNGDKPTSLYIILPPSEITRLKPLIRILMNQFLNRLTSEMEFDGGEVKNPKRRLLLLLDEFTSIGKMDIFDTALAYMRGYGLKAYIIIQDIEQLNKAYGRDNSIMANCNIRISYAANTPGTAEILSKMCGTTTIVQRKRSRSGQSGKISGNISESLNETRRPLITPDECQRLPATPAPLEKTLFGRIKERGRMLIMVAGSAPIYGTKALFYTSEILTARVAMSPPDGDRTIHKATESDAKKTEKTVNSKINYKEILESQNED